jgi:predicted amidohydrolase YtcJ
MNFDHSYIDTAFINGRVISVNENDDFFEAVGIKGNKIVFVGSTKDLLKLTDESTKIIDLDERSLIPGFIDTHYHPILNGFFGDDEDASIINTSYENCPSIVSILDLVRKAAIKRGPGAWISMMGYDQNSIQEKRHISLEELDAAAPENPVQCMRTCGHICIYNSLALAQIGVKSPQDVDKYPENEIVVEGGKLTGMVKDHTHFLLWSKVEYTETQQIRAAMKSNHLLLKNGITSVHDAGEFMTSSYRIMQKLCKSRQFKPRQYMLVHNVYGKPFALEENEHLFALGILTGLGDEYFRIGSSKFMIDGGTSGPSSATRDPYSHDPHMPGILGWQRDEVKEYIKKINDAGCQATAHAVGDLAVEFMVEGYEYAFVTNPRPEARHRIEHCTMVDQDLVQRMAKLNICPTCNPGFIAWNGRNYTKFYGDRMKYFSALRTMIDQGVRVSIASDAPSGPLEPIRNIDAAVNRIDRVSGMQTDKTQAISPLEAIRLYTLNGAYSSYEDTIKGSIEVGKLADLVVLSGDISNTQPEELLDLEIDITMIDGIIEYQK